MARLAGEFAGMVHFDVPRANADALAEALKSLESTGLHVSVARSAGGAIATGLRSVELQLVGDDRKGIVSAVTRILASHGISIESMNTEITGPAAAARRSFKIVAQLLVPQTLSNAELHAELGSLAHAMMLDIALGDLAPA